MSCHISALCITLPCPKRGLVETTFGERNSCRVEKTPISPLQSTDNTSASPSTPVMAGGGDTFWGESTFHFTPQFLTKKEEFSTYPSSGLCWRDTQHVEGESCGQATYFQVRVATQAQFPPWRIGSETRRQCSVASLVCSTVRAKSLSARSSQKKAAHPSHRFWVRPDHIFSWSFGHRKPRINCHSPSCESCTCCSNEMYLWALFSL